MIINNKNLIILIIIGFFLCIFELLHFSDKECIQYIITHDNEFYNDTNNQNNDIYRYYYIFPKNNELINSYYTDITIRRNIEHTSYLIVCWGNKNSWQWKFRGNKIIEVK